MLALLLHTFLRVRLWYTPDFSIASLLVYLPTTFLHEDGFLHTSPLFENLFGLALQED